MSGELVFTIAEGDASPSAPVNFAEAGLRERDHLQEWVLAYPQILGEDLRIVSFEFDRWLAGTGEPTYDRLDVLALDRSGRLVVAELKRDLAPPTVSMQALNYAAMVSRFSLDTLAEVYAAHRGGEQLTSEQALEELREWAPELSDETLGPPRIVLVATDFGPQVTNTSLFLYESGIDIRLVRAQLYRTAAGGLVLTTSQLLPVPAAETFMVRPRSAPPAQAAAREARARRAAIPERLVAANVFGEGQRLRIVVPAGVDQDREAIDAWLEADPARRSVSWRQDPRQPVTWAVDGEPYNLTLLVRHVIELATGQPPRSGIWGPNWYRDDNDNPLHRVAEQLPDGG
jgi:hypothetical protein